MGKFSLEQKIKDRLKGHEVHIDKRELWKGLGIEEEKERKAVWFWWMGGFAGIALLGGLWWYMQNHLEIEPNVQSSTAITIDESIAKTGNETLIEETRSERLSAIIDEVKSERNIIDNESKAQQSNTSFSPSVKSKSEQSKTVDIPGFNLTNSTAEVMGDEVKTEMSKSDQASLLDEVLKQRSGDFADNQLADLFPISGIDPHLNFTRTFEKLDKETLPLIQPIPTPRKFEFEIFGGVGNINRTLSANSEELEGYAFTRDTSESLLEHVTLGFSLKYNFGGGLYTKAGLSLNRWNEKMTYNTYSDTILGITEVPVVILFDLQGNESITYGEGEASMYSVTKWIRYNRLTQIDLPISLGYEHSFKRWSLFGEATAIVNLSQKFTGYIYSRDYNVVQNPNDFKSRIGLNMGLNAGIGYGLTPRLRARLSARYYQTLGSVLNSEIGIDQQYSSLGVRVGIGYQF